MPYSNDDIESLASYITKMLRYTEDIDLGGLLKGSKWKEVNFQDECEGGNLLGDLLLKHAAENNNPRVKDLFLKNGFKLPEQEQVAATVNEEEQNTPNVEEDRSEPSKKNEDDQFSTSYNKIKKIVASNPNITAEKFCNELKKEKIDIKITNQDGWPLLYYAVHSEGPGIIDDRIIFLKIVELLTNLNIGIDFKDTASKTVLGTAAINKQADVIKILLDSGKFNEEEKFNALYLAIIQGNIKEVEAFLGHINGENMQRALEVAMQSRQGGITQVILNFIAPETSNVERNVAEPSSNNENVSNKPVPSTLTQKTNLTTISNSGRRISNCTNVQPSKLSEKETKYKESKGSFDTSLRSDVVGVVITGLFIAAAVMVPSLAGALVCSVLAALVAIATGLHVKNSTLPSYREMEKNKVERVDLKFKSSSVVD